MPVYSTADDLVLVNIAVPGGQIQKAFTSDFILALRETVGRYFAERLPGGSDVDHAVLTILGELVAEWLTYSAEQREGVGLQIAYFMLHLTLSDARLVMVLREKRVSRIMYGLHVRTGYVRLHLPIQMKVFLCDDPDPELNALGLFTRAA